MIPNPRSIVPSVLHSFRQKAYFNGKKSLTPFIVNISNTRCEPYPSKNAIATFVSATKSPYDAKNKHNSEWVNPLCFNPIFISISGNVAPIIIIGAKYKLWTVIKGVANANPALICVLVVNI